MKSPLFRILAVAVFLVAGVLVFRGWTGRKVTPLTHSSAHAVAARAASPKKADVAAPADQAKNSESGVASDFVPGTPFLDEAHPADAAELKKHLGKFAKRVRFAVVNPSYFTTKHSPLFASAEKGHFDLNLFNDAKYPITVDDAKILGRDRYVIKGTVDGQPNSRLLIAYNNGSVSLSLEAGATQYEVNPAGGGISQVYQIDATAIPPCATPLHPYLNADTVSYYSARQAAAQTATAGSVATAASSANPDGQIYVDVLELYSAEILNPPAPAQPLTQSDVASRVDLALAESNDDFARSGIHVTLRLAHLQEVAYTETGDNSGTLKSLQGTSDGVLDNVHALRDQYGADLVDLLVYKDDPSDSGIAYIMDQEYNYYNQAWAFSVVQYKYCTGYDVLAHEFGHNFGCVHDREHTSNAGVFPYSYGYRFTDSNGYTYHTIMAYNPGTRISYFSDPDLSYNAPGSPALGVAPGLTGQADNTKTINNTAFEVSNYRLSTIQPVTSGRLVNVSTRAFTGTGQQVLIGGFVIQGSSPKTILVDAKGPSLTQYGVSGALADPMITLYDKSGNAIATNDSWNSDPTVASEIEATGFAPTDSREPAIEMQLQPGRYTAVVRGVSGTTGLALAEAYEVDQDANKIVNLSTRGYVGTGDQVMIGGFVIQGTPGETKRVLILARGPSLASQGVTNPLDDPYLKLYDKNGDELFENDDWDGSNQQAAIIATGYAPTNRRESAMIVDLTPGVYTAIVQPFDNTGGPQPGVGIIEAYEINQ